MMNYVATQLVAYYCVVWESPKGSGQIGIINQMIAMGICMGMQPAISYNHAAGNHKRTVEILTKTCRLTMISGAVISVLCILFRDAILGAFIQDAAVIAIGRVALLAGVIVGPLYGIYQMATTYFQSTGRAGYATACSVLNKGVFVVLMMYLLKAVSGMYGVLFTGAAADVLSLTAAVLMAIHVVRQPRQA